MNAKRQHAANRWSIVEEIARRGLLLGRGSLAIYEQANVAFRFSSIATQWANGCELLFDPTTGRYVELGGGG